MVSMTMHVCYESNDALSTHLMATYLRDHEVPVTLLNEASYIVGYCGAAGPLSLAVPDEFADRADEVIAQRGGVQELPEDPEYVFEGVVPPKVSGWELAISPRELLFFIGNVWLAFFLFGLLVFVAMLMEMWVAVN